jgi:hypothetical protein
VLVAASVGAGACAASPSHSALDYRRKAANTATAAISAVATAQLSAKLLLDGKAFGQFVTVNVVDAEDDANSIQSTFDSVQPPTLSSDSLRDRVDKAMQQATGGLTDLRIAVRRHRFGDMRTALATLDQALKALTPLKGVA